MTTLRLNQFCEDLNPFPQSLLVGGEGDPEVVLPGGKSTAGNEKDFLFQSRFDKLYIRIPFRHFGENVEGAVRFDTFVFVFEAIINQIVFKLIALDFCGNIRLYRAQSPYLQRRRRADERELLESFHAAEVAAGADDVSHAPAGHPPSLG